MSNEKMREEFEVAVAAYLESTGQVARLDRFPDGRYEYVDISSAWWAWQASRAAIEVEITGYDSLLRALYDGVDINDVVEAIKAQGLKVKVTP
jgi:hypothetical protein